jgi:uncharacterized protein (TIGR02246 family)
MITAALCLLLSFATPEQEIRAVMDRQVEAWNRGDVVAFMDGYLDAESITFLGRAGVTRGWQATLARYRRDYATREKMGRLTFSEQEFRALGPEHALVLGKFSLERAEAAGGNASGRYTLVFQRTAQGWKIIHDHTS